MGTWTTAVKTWAVGDKESATILNAQLRDFANGFGAWTTYTPVITQSGTVTHTATYAKYLQIQKLVVATVNLSVTGTGTAGNDITVTVPVTAAANASTIGAGRILDSGTSNYTGSAEMASTTAVVIIGYNQAAPIGTTPSFGLAAGDSVRFMVVYEAA